MQDWPEFIIIVAIHLRLFLFIVDKIAEVRIIADVIEHSHDLLRQRIGHAIVPLQLEASRPRPSNRDSHSTTSRTNTKTVRLPLPIRLRKLASKSAGNSRLVSRLVLGIAVFEIALLDANELCQTLRPE